MYVAVNNVNKTNRNRYNSVLKILCKFFFLPTETVIVAHPVLIPVFIYFRVGTFHLIKIEPNTRNKQIKSLVNICLNNYNCKCVIIKSSQ
jgi:hypothetical protein